MKNKLSKSKILVMQSGASLVAVFAMLVISVAAVISLSFGWFAKNNQVTANGMHMQAYKASFSASYEVEVYDEAQKEWSYMEAQPEDLFNGLVAPGDSVKIKVTIKNTGRYAVNLTQFGFEAPTSMEDVPKYDENGYLRYLSTELYTQLLSVGTYTKDQKTIEYPSAANVPLPENTVPAYVHFLRGGESMAPGAANRIDFMSDIGENASIPLGSGESVTFEISVSFANTNYDQNVYKGFDEHGGTCARRFFLTYDD